MNQMNHAEISHLAASTPNASAPTAAINVPLGSIQLDIEGMSCAGCVRRVEKALTAVQGVVEARVNLATRRADIHFHDGVTSLGSLEKAVAAQGYSAKAVKPDGESSASEIEEAARHFKAFCLAALFTLPVFMLEMGGHLIPAFHHWLMMQFGTFPIRLLQFILTSLVLIGPGLVFFRKGIPALLRGAPDMNSLVAVGAIAAWGYSSVATFAGTILPQGTDHVYFEAAAVIVSLILLGRALEARARGRASAAIRALAKLQPKTARVIRGDVVQDIALEAVKIGDLIIMRPGEKLPVDGKITDGSSYIDEAMMTGESAPIEKMAGSNVFAGTVNGHGSFTYRAEKIGRDTVLAQIQRMVEAAQSSKLPIEALVDKVTMWFVPFVFASALLTFILWLVIGGMGMLNHALVATVAVLIIACPCAMGLATPVSIMVASARAARLGIFFRRGEALQRLKNTHLVAFDKTGTLTQGKPQLVFMEVAANFKRDFVLAAIAGVENRSEHPIGRALAEAARAKNLDLPVITNFAARPGFGVMGEWESKKIYAGNALYMAEIGVSTHIFDDAIDHITRDGMTPFYGAIDGEIAGIFGLRDELKPHAQETIAALTKLGIKSAMITGDNKKTAAFIAKILHIDTVLAQTLPQEKLAAIRQFQTLSTQIGSTQISATQTEDISTKAKQTGEKQLVAFVGDGINDAPALAAADIGVALGGGSDVAIESADVVLKSNDPYALIHAIKLSRATLANIKQNLFWAFFYNIALIPVAAGLFYPFWGIQLSPILSAAAMSLSSIFVLLNALRLKNFAT